MKKIVLILFTFSLFHSCSKDDTTNINNPIIGEWKAIEYLDDIEDPNNIYDVLGLWEPVDNGRVLEFKSNGEFRGVFNSCDGGAFRIEQDQINASCELGYFNELSYFFEVEEDGKLMISYGLVFERFQKVISD